MSALVIIMNVSLRSQTELTISRCHEFSRYCECVSIFVFDSFIRLVLLPVALATLICDTGKSILKLPPVKAQDQIFNTSQFSPL